MIFALLILAADPPPAIPAAPTVAPQSNQQLFESCVQLVAADPAKGVAQANDWHLHGGGTLARRCLGMAYAAQQSWPSAATAFEQAAREAEVSHEAQPSELWVQTGNARLAAGDAAGARVAFDSALARGELQGAALGEANLDRARASVAMNDLKAARTDLDFAVQRVPDDPLAWLLSATLARRQGDLNRAQIDIEQAAKRSPDDASVALEAGNIAILSGAVDAARAAWQGAVANQPGTPAADAAAANLKQLDADKPKS
jgi:tetratricopeptide (TPR) repeat protein